MSLLVFPKITPLSDEKATCIYILISASASRGLQPRPDPRAEMCPARQALAFNSYRTTQVEAFGECDIGRKEVRKEKGRGISIREKKGRGGGHGDD